MTELEKNYFDAKKDLIQALNSISKLEPWQREQLAKELMGAEAYAAMYSTMRQYFG